MSQHFVRLCAVAGSAPAALIAWSLAGAQPVPPEFQVNTYTNAYQYDSAVTPLGDGGFMVAWHDSDSASVIAQRFTATAVKVGGEITVPETGTLSLGTKGPKVAGLENGGAVVAWSGAEDDVADPASTAGVAAQVLDGNGVKLGTEFHVNTTTAGTQTLGGVAALANGGFVVSWDSAPVAGGTGQDGSGYGVYARRFNADGSPAGGEIKVNTATAGDQKLPRIATLASGGFVIVWIDNAQAAFRAQRFAANGGRVGGEILIRSGSATEYQVAGLTGGGFVVTWTGAGGGVGTEVYARQFDSAGVALGPEFHVNNAYTAGAQSAGAAAGLANGGYVLVWVSDAQDGSLLGIFGQKYTSAGLVDGGEFQVNAQANDLQTAPAAALLGDGFVVTWTSDKQDGNSFGVFGRLFGNTLGGPNMINGTTGPDNLIGTSGDDLIDGKGGADVMTGLAGNDIYIVNDAADVVVESAGEGTDTVRSSVTYKLPSGVEKLYLTGSAVTNGTGNSLNNVITGNNVANVLNGAAGNDTLKGSAGSDRLVGGNGNDTLVGGPDNDSFLFNTALNASANVDKVTDFTPADDVIRLENAIFTALPTTGTLAASAFATGTAATTTAHRIIYDPATGNVRYDPDGTGPMAVVRFAQLTTKPAVTRVDFYVQ